MSKSPNNPDKSKKLRSFRELLDQMLADIEAIENVKRGLVDAEVGRVRYLGSFGEYLNDETEDESLPINKRK